MEKTDLTLENLQLLMNISNEVNCFNPDYLNWEIASSKTPEETFLTILWYSNFELYDKSEFDEEAFDFIYKKKLNEMPKYINESIIPEKIMSTDPKSVSYNWISIVARWRLFIGK